MPAKGKAAHLQRGRRDESLTVWWLRLQGYRILAATGGIPPVRWASSPVAVEVNWRASLDAAAESILQQQRRRIAQAAAVFLSGQPDAAKLQLRFDAVLLMPSRLPRHPRCLAAMTNHTGPD